MIVHALSPEAFANRLFENIVDPIIALLAFLALLLFVWTAILLIKRQKESGDRAELFKRMGIVILGLFIVFSVSTIFLFVDRLANPEIDLEKDTVEFPSFDLIEYTDPKLTPTRGF